MEHDTSPGNEQPTAGLIRSRLHRLGRDYAYVMPGFPLALVSFCLLVPMVALSIGTLIVWIGALLLPLTLMIASGFAQLSRTRLALWGAPPETVRYRPTRPGVLGTVRIAADPRRWLDFAFEALVALPLRLFTFCVAATWTIGAAAGLTYWSWVVFVPGEEQGWAHLMSLGYPDLAPQSAASIYLLDSGINLVLGLVFLLTLPPVMRGLASLDALLATHLLGSATQVSWPEPAREHTAGHRPSSNDVSITALIWAVTSFLAVVLIAVAWPVLTTHYEIHAALAMVLTVAHGAAAILAVRWAWAGAGLSLLAVLGQAAASSGIAETVLWPWPVTALLTQCVVIAVIALRRPWRETVAVWAAAFALTVVTPVLFTGGIPAGAVASGIVAVSVLAGVGLLCALLRLWGLSVDRVESAEKLGAEEAQRRKQLEERNRIARELHDVVAHSMSVINVQASTAKYRRSGIEEPVQQEFEDIAESSRQALGEMRALLGILRGDDSAPTAPVPSVSDIADLVEATRASGASISYSGEAPRTSTTVGLTAFRVVQEALSNALRHAPGSSVEVVTSVEEAGEGLLVRVVNSAPRSDADPTPGSGLGLAGIRERVIALGGTVSAGPTPDGGFAVSAALPLAEAGARSANDLRVD